MLRLQPNLPVDLRAVCLVRAMAIDGLMKFDEVVDE